MIFFVDITLASCGGGCPLFFLLHANARTYIHARNKQAPPHGSSSSSSERQRAAFNHPFHVACGGHGKKSHDTTDCAPRASYVHKTTTACGNYRSTRQHPAQQPRHYCSNQTNDTTKRRGRTTTIVKSSLARTIRGGKSQENAKQKNNRRSALRLLHKATGWSTKRSINQSLNQSKLTTPRAAAKPQRKKNSALAPFVYHPHFPLHPPRVN